MIFHWLICLFHYCLIIYRQIRVWLLPNITPGLKCCRGGGGRQYKRRHNLLMYLFWIFVTTCISFISYIHQLVFLGPLSESKLQLIQLLWDNLKFRCHIPKKSWKKVLPCTTILFCNHQLMYLSINIEFKHI